MDGLDGLQNPFMDLPQGDQCQAYYIWIDGSGQGLRLVMPIFGVVSSAHIWAYHVVSNLTYHHPT